MKLVFATGNQNKVKEIQALLPVSIELMGLLDIGCSEDIPETQPTIEGNAAQKAFYVFEKYHHNCFADDTGLEIEALNGRPGVLSARYAGEAKDANANMDKILTELKNETNRTAHFKTVISLVIDGEEVQFEGVVEGTILKEKRGGKGFGYDPIFLPKDSDRSFAEMDVNEKNEISHRALAVKKLVAHLNKVMVG
ncbi:MAG TPA: non-canonical purine NTP diphosphatase [Bacteroidia bacterium]|nr:non-canonical purine NTP diphosphatase [Bacteroidia bacterium]HRG51195.1 non-canonical purine NTP diphosphatase [Bacteroidia bacterium]